MPRRTPLPPLAAAVRRAVARATLAFTIVAAAIVSVGITAAPTSPFSITIEPALVRMDDVDGTAGRAAVLAADIDVKLGSVHLHIAWPGIKIRE